MTTPPEDAFILDVRGDLQRVDPVMNQVLRDPATSAEFIRDPSGVLSRLGLHPPASRATHDRVNRIFYAVLTNTELIELITEAFNEEVIREAVGEIYDQNARQFEEGLREGLVSNSVDFDVAAANYIFQQTDTLRRIYQLTLHDLNNRRLLQRAYSIAELDDYIDSMLVSIRERRPIREHIPLEVWEAPHYGIGTGYAVGETEVGPAVTVGALVEVGVFLTLALGLWGSGVAEERAMIIDAVRGNPEAVRAFATSSTLLHFAGELLVYVNNFERR